MSEVSYVGVYGQLPEVIIFRKTQPHVNFRLHPAPELSFQTFQKNNFIKQSFRLLTIGVSYVYICFIFYRLDRSVNPAAIAQRDQENPLRVNSFDARPFNNKVLV